MRVLWLLLVVPLAGCMDDGRDFHTGYHPDKVEMNVLRGWSGTCVGFNNQGCEYAEISIDNSANDEDLDVKEWSWEAVGTDGGVYDAEATDGPDEIAAGAKTTIKVSFDASSKITQVRFGIFDPLVTMAVPQY